MKLNEAKEILKNNGYELQLNESVYSFCEAYPVIVSIIVFFSVVFVGSGIRRYLLWYQ